NGSVLRRLSSSTGSVQRDDEFECSVPKEEVLMDLHGGVGNVVPARVRAEATSERRTRAARCGGAPVPGSGMSACLGLFARSTVRRPPGPPPPPPRRALRAPGHSDVTTCAIVILLSHRCRCLQPRYPRRAVVAPKGFGPRSAGFWSQPGSSQE